ncbi:hypothetical protein LCGC14_1503780 [marine sediment metagenome]|uniref:Uncharacterized protein n=1 Tax=marine sediment metagenome TaxID=412755 RepID=A0A0F9LIP8_9ZZZZ
MGYEKWGFDGRPLRGIGKQAVMKAGMQHSNVVGGLSGEVAAFRRFELVSITVEAQGDPYVLYNRWQQIVYQWPDEYIPDFVEVREVCDRLQGGQR